MKVITLYQPWASLIALGYKTIETRSWSTPYRGPLAIHAGKKWTWVEKDAKSQAIGWLRDRGQDVRGLLGQTPLGSIVAVADLIDCQGFNTSTHEFTDYDHAFGDIRSGRFAWFLANIRALEQPIPFQGMQGLGNLPAYLADRLEALMETR